MGSFSIVGAIADIQLVRPADQENFGLTITVVAPPGEHWRLLEAMNVLADKDGFWEISATMGPWEDDA